MPSSKEDLLTHEVYSALKRYRQADELEIHPARDWPVVKELCERGAGVVTAIRQILGKALDEIQDIYPNNVRLVREQYLQGRSVEALASEFMFDPSSLHRQRNRLIKELAVIIAKHNRQAQQRYLTERFRPRQPVFGCEVLAAKIIALLDDPAAPALIVVEGMGGLGKTTLAQCVAQQCVGNEAFASVLWVSAKQVDFDIWGGQKRIKQPSLFKTDDLLRDLARELAIDAPLDAAALRNEVQAHCRMRQYLIIFDNLETVADLEALAPLIDMLATPSRILITTRDHTPEALPATLTRAYIPLSELDPATSYQLLRSAATYTDAPALVQASDDDLARIYTITGGNPLALWLVAGQAHDVPWTAFIQSLVDHCPSGSTGYQLYDYLYRRSWEQLSDDAQAVLFAMHRCETGVEYDHLLELSMLSQQAFDDAVRELRRRTLLLIDSQYIYSIHRLTYTFLRVVIAGWWE